MNITKLLKKLRAFISSPIFDDEEKTRTAWMINIILLATFTLLILGLASMAPFVRVDNPATIIGSLIIIVHSVIFLVLMRRGRVRLAVLSFSLMFLLVTLGAIVLGGSVRLSSGFLLIAIIIPTFLIHPRAGLYFLLFSSAGVFIVAILEKNGVTEYHEPSSAIGQAIVFTVIASLVYALIYVARRSLMVALNSTQAANQELMQEITERHRIEAFLRESETRYRLITDNASDLIWTMDLQMNITYVSPSIEKIRGFTIDEVMTQSQDQMMSPESIQVVGETLQTMVLEENNRRTLDEHQPVPSEIVNTCELELLHKDGRRVWVETKITFLRDVDGMVMGILGLSRDVSERRKSEAEIRRLNVDLEERVRQRTAQLEAANEELEAFAYSVSHDLRAPLRGIDGYTRFFLEDYGKQLDEKGGAYLQRVRDAAQNMNQLIENLLQLSRLTRQVMNVKLVNMSRLVNDVIEELSHDQEETRAEVVVASGMECEADEALLRVVFINLINNALKFSRHEPSPQVTVGEKEINGELVYFIQDNGVGFDMAYANQLFQPFQRLHRPDEFEGTGIGLATVRRIIQRHGGNIWAESTPGKGAVFYFTLNSTRPDPDRRLTR